MAKKSSHVVRSVRRDLARGDKYQEVAKRYRVSFAWVCLVNNLKIRASDGAYDADGNVVPATVAPRTRPTTKSSHVVRSVRRDLARGDIYPEVAKRYGVSKMWISLVNNLKIRASDGAYDEDGNVIPATIAARPRFMTEETEAAIIRDRLRGDTVATLVERYGVSQETIRKVCKGTGWEEKQEREREERDASIRAARVRGVPAPGSK